MLIFCFFKQKVSTTILLISKLCSFKQMLIFLLLYITVFMRNKVVLMRIVLFLNPDFSIYFLFIPTYSCFQVLLHLNFISKSFENKELFQMRNIYGCHHMRITDY